MTEIVNMYRILVRKLKGGDHFTNLGVDMLIIVKLTLKKQDWGWDLHSIISG
jgi:hypothetical protein